MSSSSGGRQVAEILQAATAELHSAGVREARLDSEILLGHVLAKSRTQLYLSAREEVTQEDRCSFSKLLKRRKAREPIAYILEEREFWSLPFRVSPAVLVPRPETEFLIETVLTNRRGIIPSGPILDLCCGSGIISVVLARELQRKVFGVDISREALKIASENCSRHEVSDGVSLVQADLGSCFSPRPLFSLIVSNPPYITTSDIAGSLDPEVREFEPTLALDGGTDGLDVIRRIIKSLPGLLLPGGELFMEIGELQAVLIEKFLSSSGEGRHYREIVIYKDYAGRDRVLHARKTDN